jgi:hypothetical protein
MFEYYLTVIMPHNLLTLSLVLEFEQVTLPFSKTNAQLFQHLPFIDMEHTPSPSYFLPNALK